ncbi:hypothetical protein [Dyadobacter bucti]|uniref:hypothetical protein n=1 Tax=Dyadobacter bucti TaxID=2572203 RepID=UPI003F6F5BC2
MALPQEIDVNTIKYYDANGNEIKNGGSGSGSGSGIWGSIFGALPGIISSLFPSGVNNGGNQYPYVSQLPNGNTSVQLAGSNNNLMMFIMLGLVAYLVFTGKPPVKASRK